MHRRTLLFVAASLAPLAAPTQAQPGRVQFNFDAEFERARSMGKELQPRIARIGLLLFSNAMMRARAEQQPFGYEKGGDFLKAATEIQRVLRRNLSGEASEISIPLNVPNDVAAMMASRYKDNEGKLPTFLIDIRKPPGPMRELPDIEVVRYQLWTSTLVAARDRSVWDIGWKFTGFFPFC